MSIPNITSYTMPRHTDLPTAHVQWTVVPSRAALLIHDMQKYFLAPFPQRQSPLVELVRNVTLLRQRCTALGVPVLYTAQRGGMTDEERGLLKDFWGHGMAVAPEDRAVVDELAPLEHERIFTKWRYSAFHRSGLLDHLQDLGRDQLIVCGVYAHVGCLMTACDAFSHDIQPFLVADAVADFSRAYHELALTYAAERCAATHTTDMILSALKTGTAINAELA
jgi:isochorismate hydrolase